MDGNGNSDGNVKGGGSAAAPLNDGAAEKDVPQCVQVAVHIRPLIGFERAQGCKDCITVVPGEPQVQIGTHSFTFDHVYGSTASPSSAIFKECVGPLVDGLFQGYNATVLAYGQTGSGKTYTMGTGYTLGGNTEGIIPLVMEAIFKKVKELKDQGEILLKVSFIEILKEEVHDLLDPNPLAAGKLEGPGGGKPTLHVKAPIQIRETANGGITLTGVTEIDVTTQEEMASVLAQGSLSRATGSTNMNNQSSRSHAIFTISMVNKRKWDAALSGDPGTAEDRCEDFVCAKLHLVDLAGSERAKRTGADGLRFKEGVHINKGLLALGNVISALGDEKKRKEGGHVPYRDSKLTRLLQDSLGGNSRTVMIACVSPADTNAEETLNTLKYANRARNIQNKAIINRDPAVAEMQRMRNQLDYLQAELLCYRAGGVSSDEVQVLKHKISWLEASNAELRQELRECHESSQLLEERVMDAQILKDKLCLKLEQLRNGKTWKEIDNDDGSQDVDLIKGYLSKIQELENEVQRLQAATNSQTTRATRSSAFVDRLDIENNTLVSSHEAFTDIADLQAIDVGVDESREGEEDEVTKELEHSLLQDEMGKELQELDKCLEQKEAEMKLFNKTDTTMLKQHYEKKFMELEEEKKALLKEMDRLKAELENISHTTDGNTQHVQEGYLHKLKALESQIAELKKKQENQAQLLKQKQKSDEAAKRLQEEIQRIKTHKVQLQHKMKQESEQFRHWKASREKELLQLKKEGRRNEYEMHKLQALNQRQKMVLQRKTEEAAMATKRLKELLEARKVPSRDAGSAGGNGSVQSNEKALQQSLEHELEVVVRVHEVRSEYEKQTQARAAMAKELAKLKQESEASNSTPSMSPSARHSRIRLLETMQNTSSSTLVAMASQLSEAEERERAFSGRGRWNQLRSMGDAKNLLTFLFNAAAYSRCQLRDKELEIREMKENIRELSSLLRQSETQRKELEKQQRLKEQVGSHNPIKRNTQVNSAGSYSMGNVASKQPQNGTKFSDISNISNMGNDNFPYDLRKASRGAQNYNYSHSDEIDILEGEDMDISDGDQSDEESDEEWVEDWEKRTMKKNRVSLVAGERARPPKAGSKALDRKSSDSLLNEGQDNGSTGHFSGEILCGENKSKSSEAEGCCSCSASSGCKTKKCECKAAGSFCRSKCGCKTNRCSNRETVDIEAEPSTVDTAIQIEVAEAVETLGMDKTRRQNQDKDEGKSGNTDSDDLIEMEVKTKAAEQLLAVHGAALLQTALKENLSSHEMQVGSNTKEEGEVEQKGHQRRPLTDIGNTTITSHDQGNNKANRRKKWQKSLIQLVPVAAPQSNVEPQEPTSAISTTKLVATGNSVTNISNVAKSSNTEEALSTSIQELSIPLKLPRSMHKNASSVTSPLKARNAGASEEGGGDKFSNGPGSPGRCGRGLNGKENLRSN
jgi:kinesin family protein 4/21/27